ncbi:MAG TPA: hypothetical protein VEF04_18825 [Blastocatellia bacterium]|nr:hypothetical protein [Blastocatellia bacterium]
MRTIFEDTNERENRLDDKADKSLPLVLWIVALVFVAGAFFTYRWANRKPPEQPFVASLENTQQVSKAVYNFNEAVKAGKWDEAEKMLSTEAKQRLANEKTTLHDSLLASRKGKSDKVIQAMPVPTEHTIQTATTRRIDTVFMFENNESITVPLTLIVENNQLLINSW